MMSHGRSLDDRYLSLIIDGDVENKILVNETWGSLVRRKFPPKEAITAIKLDGSEIELARKIYIDKVEQCPNIDLDDIVLEVRKLSNDAEQEHQRKRQKMLREILHRKENLSSNLFLCIHSDQSDTEKQRVSMNPLQVAVYFNEIDILEIIMSHESDHLIDAFYESCREGHLAIHKVLYNYQSTGQGELKEIPRFTNHVIGFAGCLAAQYNHSSILEELMKQDSSAFLNVSISDKFSEYEKSLSYIENATRLAMRYYSTDSLQYIFKQGILMNDQKRKCLETALDIAVNAENTERINSSIITILKEDHTLMAFLHSYTSTSKDLMDKARLSIVKSNILFDYYLS